MSVEALSFSGFQEILKHNFSDIIDQKKIAVAVSGGPDSLALSYLLSECLANTEVHALTVDHRLRPESSKEAEQVSQQLGNFKNVHHAILVWEDAKLESGVSEAARKARYALMQEYCEKNDIGYLFLAHHRDDQAETFLIRLAKGSGLDGLSGMRPQQKYSNILTLVRPLLDVSKEMLVAICRDAGLEYSQDPTNESLEYTRPRLRKSREILETEGLTSERLARTAMRLGRAQQALDSITDTVFQKALEENSDHEIVLDFDSIKQWPDDIGLRILLKCMHRFRQDQDYAPRFLKVERLFDILKQSDMMKPATLGGCIIELKNNRLKIQKEP